MWCMYVCMDVYIYTIYIPRTVLSLHGMTFSCLLRPGFIQINPPSCIHHLCCQRAASMQTCNVIRSYGGSIVYMSSLLNTNTTLQPCQVQPPIRASKGGEQNGLSSLHSVRVVLERFFQDSDCLQQLVEQ